jgi:hypothetical protein
MKTEMFCEELCTVDLGNGTAFEKAMREQYHANWLLDGLPAASKLEDDSTITTRYWGGIPIGFINAKTDKVYIYNHFNLEVMYHAIEGATGYHVVRFIVEPLSIKRDNMTRPIPSCNKTNPNADPVRDTYIHTDWDMVNEAGREPQQAMGKVLFTYDVTWIEHRDLRWAHRWDIYLSMDNAFPPIVHWIMPIYSMIVGVILGSLFLNLLIRDLRYRAEHLREEGTQEEDPRWWSRCYCARFIRPMMLFMAVTGVVSLILILAAVIVYDIASDGYSFRYSAVGAVFYLAFVMANAVLCGAFLVCVGRDLRYNPLPIQDSEDGLPEDDLHLWPMSEQVYLAPKCAPLLLSVLCGTGAQLLATTILSATVFALGIVDPSVRGAPLMCVLLVFTLMGTVGGYVTARFYKAFGGYLKGALLGASATALLFPGSLLLCCLGLDMYCRSKEGSTSRLAPRSMPLLIVGFWLCLMVPITLLSACCPYGFCHGSDRSKIFPIQRRSDEATDKATGSSNRSCTDKLLTRLLISGLLPLAAMSNEYKLMIRSFFSAWYYSAQFLLVSVLLAVSTNALVSLLLWYRQLRAKNFEWWWLSFSIGPSCGFYTFLFSVALFFSRSSERSMAISLICISVMGVASFGIACMMGFVGLSSCLLFNAWRYAAAQAT